MSEFEFETTGSEQLIQANVSVRNLLFLSLDSGRIESGKKDPRMELGRCLVRFCAPEKSVSQLFLSFQTTF